jgi:hypothetical protein
MTPSAAVILAKNGGDHEKAREYIRRLMAEYNAIAVEINHHETETNQRKYEAAHV